MHIKSPCHLTGTWMSDHMSAQDYLNMSLDEFYKIAQKHNIRFVIYC